jgi:long-subunit acyl-CoA synthetase (AMP-forming)
MSSILTALERIAAHTPYRVAVIAPGERISYATLAQRSQELAEKLSIFAGQCVALDLPDGIDWLVADLACLRAGVICLPLPQFFTPKQREDAMQHAGAAAVLRDGLQLSPLPHPPVPLPPHTAKITFTSGSTGSPKGVCLSQEGMERVAQSLHDVLKPETAWMFGGVLPLAVLLENVAGFYTVLLAGGCYHLLQGSAAKGFPALLKAYAEHGITSTILVPELLRGLLGCAPHPLPVMRFMAVGGAHVSAALIRQAQLQEWPVFEGYGLSESASVTCTNMPDAHRPGTVGKPLPHIRLSLAPDGEILLHDPLLCGYVGEASARDVYATGDLGSLDPDGYLRITGRKKNLLITTTGRNIAPEWPESELLAETAIAQALVAGDGQPFLAALIVSAQDDATVQRAVDAANDRLPAYARIVRWCRCDAFTPANGMVTANGRLKRDVIHAAFATPLHALFNEGENHGTVLYATGA